MKTAACILIIVISALIGSGFRRDIKRRCEALEALERICEKLRSEISFRAVPIDELILQNTADSKCGRLFSEVYRNIGDGFSEVWQECTSRWAKSIGLTAEEIETVLMLKALGSADTDGETKLLRGISQRLSDHSKNAREELGTKGRMMFSCSMLAGLALVIIVI